MRIDCFHHGCPNSTTEIQARLDQIAELLTGLTEKVDTIMATMQQVLDDLDVIKQEAAAYIAGRDAIDVDLRAQIAALVAANPAVQADVDAAFQKAEDAKGLLAAPAAPAP